MKDKYTNGKKMARNGRNTVIYKGTFVSNHSLVFSSKDASYTRAQNVCPGWPVYEVKQPQEKWACDFHDEAPPLSFQLQVAEVIF